MPAHTMVGFIVAVAAFVLACVAGYLFGVPALVAVLFKGLVASFVISGIVWLLNRRRTT